MVHSGAAAGRCAIPLALALWSLLPPACRSLSLEERGGLEAEEKAAHVLGGRQLPSPGARLGAFHQEDGLSTAGADVASGAAKRWADSLRKARASSFRTIARILNNFTGRAGQPLLEIEEVCNSFGLDEASCARVRIYLGGVSHFHHRRVARVSQLARSPELFRAVAISLRDFGCHSKTFNKEGIDNYFIDFCKALDASDAADVGRGSSSLDERAIVFFLGDAGQNHNFCLPTFTKTRAKANGDRGLSVLLDLNHERHWAAVSDVSSQDSPLSDKREELVWRGASTGGCDESLPGSRMMLVSKYFDQDIRIDVGISELVQGCEKAARYQKEPMTMHRLLQSKYILVVDGNDKASGLNWVLASNSVPFMIEPAIESWLMESSLTAWVHYVPVQPDFSDLGAQLDWAAANPDRVAEIADAGARHMRAFADPDREAKIEGAVLTAYFDRVEIVSGEATADEVDPNAEC